MSIKKTVGFTTLAMIIISIIIIGIVGFLAIKFGSVIIFAVALPAFTQKLVSDGGLNYWMAQTIAVVFTATLLIVSFYVIRSHASPSVKVLRLIILILFTIAAYSFTIYGLQQSEVQAKIIRSEHWGGNQLPSPKKCVLTKDSALFDPEIGKSLVWYYKHENGEIDAYSSPGIHPRIGKELKAMDFETAKLIHYYFVTGQAEKMINNDKVVVAKIVKTDEALASKSTMKKKKTVVTKESATQLARKQLTLEFEQLKSFICQTQQNP